MSKVHQLHALRWRAAPGDAMWLCELDSAPRAHTRGARPAAAQRAWLSETALSTFCSDRAWTALLNRYLDAHPLAHLRVPRMQSGVAGPLSAHRDEAHAAASDSGKDAAMLMDALSESEEVVSPSPPVHSDTDQGSTLPDGPFFPMLAKASHANVTIESIISVRQRPPAATWCKVIVVGLYPAHMAVRLLVDGCDDGESDFDCALARALLALHAHPLLRARY